MIVTLCILIGCYWIYSKNFKEQFAKTMNEVQIINDSFSEHSLQIISKVDTLLRAVRGYYIHSGSIEDTENFIAGLGYDKLFVENIYLINAQGKIFIPSNDRIKRLNTSHRDYFQFHLANSEDLINIGPVGVGQVTGKNQFRVTRRLNNQNGAFGGVILIPIEPKSFTNYYCQLLRSSDNIATLLGINDHKIRARSIESSSDIWQKPIESILWDALKEFPTGSYKNKSPIDNIERQFVYKRVSNLPLVMVTGFSNRDVQHGTTKQMQPIIIAVILVEIIIIMLALIISIIYLQREEMHKLATIDSLTGIFNRRHIETIGHNEISRTHRYNRPLSLIMLDIDHFKMINDKWGHPTGDRVIQAFAKAILKVSRSQDIIGRLGGEEFLAILPETDQNGAKVIADRIRKFIKESITTVSEDGSIIRFTVSIGIATIISSEESFESLLSRSDKGLYKAKESGRDCVVAI
ncbi:MAG: GGDEF domain-containing protein [Desulfobacterales bacterium]|nr:GGDEF domain-containing protein [Desulfobacterales bacterium]